MKDFSTVLIPFDFSGQAEGALSYATQFFRGQSDKRIIILHVLENHPGATEIQNIQQRLQAIAERHQSDTTAKISWETLAGEIPEGILLAQQKLQKSGPIATLTRIDFAHEIE